jgi:gamma-glutamyltranspeptidase / glutathione hydrolase
MSPGIVEDKEGSFIFATGAAGGSNIITANFQVIHHFIDQGLTARRLLILSFALVAPDKPTNRQSLFFLIEQAINSPRMHDQIYPVGTTFETADLTDGVPAYPNSTIAYLASLGHPVQLIAPGVSISASIGYRDGQFDPASDPRIPGSGTIVV